MPLKSLIIGSSTGRAAEVVNSDEVDALAVATRPLKIFYNMPLYFTNEAGSRDMNVNISFTGTPDKIHNGIDDVLWTASGIIGPARWDFNSVAQAHSGTHSIDGTTTIGGDTVQFAKGANIDLSNYSTVTGWVYLTNWSTGSRLDMYGWDTGTGLQAGNTVDISEYGDHTILNAWQKVAIPLSAFGLEASTIDAFRIVVVKGAQNPDFYLDDIQVEEVGVPEDFIVRPRPGTWLHLTHFDSLVVDEYDSTQGDGTVPGIPIDGFLGVPSLSLGFLGKQVQADKVMFQSVIKDFADIMGLPRTIIAGCGYDGTDTWVKTTQPLIQPVTLKYELDDKFIYTVRDNLSGLKKVWISVAGYEEIR